MDSKLGISYSTIHLEATLILYSLGMGALAVYCGNVALICNTCVINLPAIHLLTYIPTVIYTSIYTYMRSYNHACLHKNILLVIM